MLIVEAGEQKHYHPGACSAHDMGEGDLCLGCDADCGMERLETARNNHSPLEVSPCSSLSSSHAAAHLVFLLLCICEQGFTHAGC